MVVIDGSTIVDHVELRINADDHWILMGPNGGGKSTLLSVLAGRRHPTAGMLTVDGFTLGRDDLRPLRRRIGVASAGLAGEFRPAITAAEVVVSGRAGALETWWDAYDDADWVAAEQRLAQVGLAGRGGQSFGSLSSGERQRCMLARALVNDPALLVLDEPTAGLDLAGREELLATIEELAASPHGPATIMATHHVEDIHRAATHIVGLAQGSVRASGPIDETLTAAMIGDLFGLGVELRRDRGRWFALATNR